MQISNYLKNVTINMSLNWDVLDNMDEIRLQINIIHMWYYISLLIKHYELDNVLAIDILDGNMVK